MRPYDHRKIEKKWQKAWTKEKLYKTPETTGKTKRTGSEKCYVLDMFPYPSGEGLHVGHPKGYIGSDIYARFKRMQGADVLHPMGWDAFGLPAENYALKNKLHPRKAVEDNIKRFKEQLSKIGFSYDWEREINTTDPRYYRWTQWIFLKLFERGLAYRSEEPINWCPSCKTGLALEDLEGGACERCGSLVEQKPLPQWVLKIREYADRLLQDIDDLDWPESVKESQRNWIGKSEGAEFRFPLIQNRNFVLVHGFEGSVKKNFFPWLTGKLEASGARVTAPELPNSDTPDEEEQVAHVLKSATFNENTVLFGHSLGTVVAMKVLERLDKPIAGLVLAGAFIDIKRRDDGEPKSYDKKFSWDFDFEKIKKNASGNITVLAAKYDTAVPLSSVRRVRDALGGEYQEVFAEDDHFCGDTEPVILDALLPAISVFTTRPDTLFGATYLVLAPEHKSLKRLMSTAVNREEVSRYIESAEKKTDLERTAGENEKTGVELSGVKARNPATGEAIPVWVADYVLAHYGTGAIMAVPAHDERDRLFAEKYGLQVRVVIEPETGTPQDNEEERTSIVAVVRDPKRDTFLSINWGPKLGGNLFVGGGVGPEEDELECARREIAEETGYTDIKYASSSEVIHHHYRAHSKGVNRRIRARGFYFELASEKREEVKHEEDEKGKFIVEWITREDASVKVRDPLHALVFSRLVKNRPYSGEGIITNSGDFDGMKSVPAKDVIIKFAGGERRVDYKLRDWVFSRQRYWGEPIPLVFCDHCEARAEDANNERLAGDNETGDGGFSLGELLNPGWIAVQEVDLPVVLPEVRHYEPTGTGESPLANIEEWVKTACPKCGNDARRETNTMPQWAGSSWYYLRYTDPGNDSALADEESEKHWMPVDVYVGGVEHATRHLIYARFWHKFLYDAGVVSTDEPFCRLKNQGLIAGTDGRKMSKRWGNVVNPDFVVETYGADTLRLYEMFMGPFEEGAAWSTESIIGSRRFLEKVWRLQAKILKDAPQDDLLETILHRTIKKVTEDIEAFRFNTAISALMILANAFDGKEQIRYDAYMIFLKLLSPFAPHITEELRHVIGAEERGERTASIHRAPWPHYDEEKTNKETMHIVVQVNGRVRDSFEIARASDADEIKRRARELDTVGKWLSGKKIQKEIYVPGKLVNIVTD